MKLVQLSYDMIVIITSMNKLKIYGISFVLMISVRS